MMEQSLKISKVTSVADRIQALRKNSWVEQTTFLHNGGWNLLHVWMLQSLSSKQNDLLLSILNLLIELPSISVLSMLEDRKYNYFTTALELIKNDLEEKIEEKVKQLCSPLLASWQFILKQAENNKSSSEDVEKVNAMQLCSITFRIICKDGSEVILQPTVKKVWWKMTLNGQTSMIRMKEQCWKKLVETDSDTNSDTDSVKILPTSPLPKETPDVVLLSSDEDNSEETLPNSLLLSAPTPDSDEEVESLSIRKRRVAPLIIESEDDEDGNVTEQINHSSSSTTLTESPLSSPSSEDSAKRKRVDKEQNQNKPTDLQDAIRRVKQKMTEREENSKKLKFCGNTAPFRLTRRRKRVDQFGKEKVLSRPRSSPQAMKQVNGMLGQVEKIRDLYQSRYKLPRVSREIQHPRSRCLVPRLNENSAKSRSKGTKLIALSESISDVTEMTTLPKLTSGKLVALTRDPRRHARDMLEQQLALTRNQEERRRNDYDPRLRKKRVGFAETTSLPPLQASQVGTLPSFRYAGYVGKESMESGEVVEQSGSIFPPLPPNDPPPPSKPPPPPPPQDSSSVSTSHPQSPVLDINNHPLSTTILSFLDPSSFRQRFYTQQNSSPQPQVFQVRQGLDH